MRRARTFVVAAASFAALLLIASWSGPTQAAPSGATDDSTTTSSSTSTTDPGSTSTTGPGSTTSSSTSTSSSSTTSTTTPGPVATTIELTAEPDPAWILEATLLTARVTTADASTPSGTVSFFSKASPLPGCTDVPLVGDTATCLRFFPSPAGDRDLIAKFNPAVPFAAAVDHLALAVGEVATRTSLVAVPAEVEKNQTVRLTATVATADRSNPKGKITFYSGTSALPDCTGVVVVNNVATCDRAFTTAGDRKLSARFVPTGRWTASSSGEVTVKVTERATRTTVTIGDPQPKVGAKQRFTAKVRETVAPNNPVTKGTVTFLVGTSPIPGCTNLPLDDPAAPGDVTCDWTFTTKGPRTITARYAEAGPFASSSGTLDITIVEIATSVFVSASQDTVRVGQPIDLTAAVDAADNSQPTGTVTFFVADSAIPGCVDVPVANSRATCRRTFTTAGDREITARFKSPTTYGPSSGRVTIGVR